MKNIVVVKKLFILVKYLFFSGTAVGVAAIVTGIGAGSGAAFGF